MGERDRDVDVVVTSDTYIHVKRGVLLTPKNPPYSQCGQSVEFSMAFSSIHVIKWNGALLEVSGLDGVN